MNVDEIVKLMKAASDCGLTAVEIKEGEFKLSLKKEKEMPQIVAVGSPVSEGSVSPAAVQAVSAQAVIPQTAPQAAAVSGGADIGSDNVITSPLVGTFYNASAPGAEPFVKEGDTVKKGQVLGIIEAMKLMNEIESEFDGVVEAVLVSNEEVVEYGQPLFRIK